METRDRSNPTVLFVCNTNGGKSQMAEALMRAHAGDAVTVHSAGVNPGGTINAESAASVARLGADMSTAQPKPLDADLLRSADRVIIVGGAQLEPVDGMTATIERWDTDEPSRRGIEGDERMDLIRDDIQARVETLASELGKR